ncbi:MAG: DMT family transporter [Eubacteriales bacterium]|nr:DMT family transporter [Eubacteriales bacterium]
MDKRVKNAGGILCVMASAVIFGFTPVLAALSYQGGNNGVTMAFLRALLPLPLLYLLARGSLARTRPTAVQLRGGALLGLLLFGCTLLLYSSYLFIPVSIATTLHFLYPIYVALYETIAGRKRLGAWRTLGLALGLGGVLLFLENSSGALDLRGVALAGASGVCYAAYIIVLDRPAASPLPLYPLMLIISVTGVALCGFTGLALGQLTFALTSTAWLYAAAVALLVAVVACVLFQAGVRRIGDANAAIFSLFEPLTSILFSVLLMGDKLSASKLVGCALILLGLISTSIGANPSRRQAA